MSTLPDPTESRTADHPIEELFLKRWSPRAMTGEQISDDNLNSLFEAARWAPSTRNEQEWRYLYARNNSQHWDTFFNLLAEGNQSWCEKASVLVLIVSHTKFQMNDKLNPVHSFDCGASFENLALQGAAMGLVVHGMAGFDYGKAKTELNIPEDYEVQAMIAIGQPGDPNDLPEQLREREQPSGRKPIEEITCEGPFAF